MNDCDDDLKTDSRTSPRRRFIYAVAGIALLIIVGAFAVQRSTETPEQAGTVDLSAAALTKEKQEQIWEVEHFAFELETFFGKPLASALGSGQWESLESRLADSFSGSIFQDDATSTVIQTSSVTQAARTSKTSPLVGVDAAGFVEARKRFAQQLSETTKTNFRVLELSRIPDTKDRWAAKFLMTLSGKSKASTLRILEAHSTAVLTFSNDNDIRSGAIVCEWHVESENVRSSPQLLMEDVSVISNLDALPLIDNWTVDAAEARQYWRQMAVEDFDRDGFLDIAAASFLGRPLLLRHAADETYRDVAAEMGVHAWPVDDSRLVNLALWIDYNADGYPDLLIGDQLYRNEKGQKFNNVTKQSQLVIDHHPMGGVVADYDCDGDLDLYILYQHSTENSATSGPKPWVGDALSGAGNTLWQNQGDGRFVDVTEESGTSGGARNSFAAVWHFHDDDHFPDLYIANDFGKNIHLRNRGDGTFEDISDTTGTADFSTSMGVAAGDIDNDGHPEIYVANMYSKMGRRIIAHVSANDYPKGVFEQIQGSCAGNRLYSRTTDSKIYTELSESLGINAVGWAYAPTFVDLDNDGWLDIYATTGFMSFDRRKPDG